MQEIEHYIRSIEEVDDLDDGNLVAIHSVEGTRRSFSEHPRDTPPCPPPSRSVSTVSLVSTLMDYFPQLFATSSWVYISTWEELFSPRSAEIPHHHTFGHYPTPEVEFPHRVFSLLDLASDDLVPLRASRAVTNFHEASGSLRKPARPEHVPLMVPALEAILDAVPSVPTPRIATDTITAPAKAAMVPQVPAPGPAADPVSVKHQIGKFVRRCARSVRSVLCGCIRS